MIAEKERAREAALQEIYAVMARTNTLSSHDAAPRRVSGILWNREAVLRAR